jgi:hypothetical protein
VEADDARIRAAVAATVDAGTAYFKMRIESEPAGVMRSRSNGVCDFTHLRAAGHTVTDVPADVPDVFQITDGGVVYSQDVDDEWVVLDMGGWAAASLMSVLGWLYGVVDVRAGDCGDHGVTVSAQRAIAACPVPLRDELRTAFHQAGHLDAVATGRVATDAWNRVTRCRLELPSSRNGMFGSLDVGSRITLTLTDFGEPVHIRPPDAGPAQPIEEYVEPIIRRAEESG